jgi:hypothetical protein
MKTVSGAVDTCVYISIVIKLNLNASNEKVCTNATTFVESIVENMLTVIYHVLVCCSLFTSSEKVRHLINYDRYCSQR